MDCLGCRIANGLEPDLNIVYENEYITCVLDIDPFNEGHTLILPKKHYWDVDEMDAKTAHAVMETSQKLSALLKRLYQPDGIRIIADGGKFNDLTHYHMHVLPRYEGDGLLWGEPLRPDGAGERLGETRRRMVEALAEKKPMLKKAMDTLEFLSQDAAARVAYDAGMKALSDEHSRIESAEAKGRTETSKEIAIKLLDRGIDLQTISEATSLPVEEIKGLRQ
ncbi:HIT domain-containing protein [Paenibacillus sp. FSL R7-0204]|uniref:HIT domain-containing protein n=1 Tax=Paenibacillus sp. FSL R7-0204 TaxID=2921675 RepID=UPI0030FBC9CF